MLKFLKFGCLGIIGLFFLLMAVVFIYNTFFLTKEEKEKRKTEAVQKRQNERDSAQLLAGQVMARMHLACKEVMAMSSLTKASRNNEKETMKCADCKVNNTDWDMLQLVSYDEILQYNDSQFRESALLKGPWSLQNMEVLSTYFKRSKKGEYRDLRKVIDEATGILNKKYLLVVIPLEYEKPEVVSDRYFTPGYFYGRLAVMQPASGKLLGYTTFEAKTTLTEIRNNKAKVRIGRVKIPLSTDSPDSRLNENFNEEFYLAALNAFHEVTSHKSTLQNE